MNPSPQICPACCHVFPPGSPEPSWCPDCGRLCSITDPPYVAPPPPDEYPQTDRERRRWFLWFWALLILGPAMVMLAQPLARALLGLLPTPVPLLTFGVPFLSFCLPVVAAVGSAFCLGKAQSNRRSFSSFLTFVILTGFGILFGEWALVAIWWTVVR